MSVAAPPIETAEQFLRAKAEPSELIGGFGRGIAADAVAIDDVHLAAVELRRSWMSSARLPVIRRQSRYATTSVAAVTA